MNLSLGLGLKSSQSRPRDYSSKQPRPPERLEDWADRIMTLATRAFKDLPEQYSNSQAVVRFCQGLTDKEASHHVCMQEPKSMEQALNGIKWYQYVHQSIYTENRRDGQSHEYDEPANIYQVSETPTREGAEAFSTSPQLTNLQEEIRGIKSGLDKFFVERLNAGKFDFSSRSGKSQGILKNGQVN